MMGGPRHTSKQRNSSMANPFVHLELNTPDLAKAKTFYSALFGWEFQDNEMSPTMIYSTFKPEDGPRWGHNLVPRRTSRLARLRRCEGNQRVYGKSPLARRHYRSRPAGNPRHRIDDYPQGPNRLHHRPLPAKVSSRFATPRAHVPRLGHGTRRLIRSSKARRTCKN